MIYFPWFQIYDVFPSSLWLVDVDVVGWLEGLEDDVKSIDGHVDDDGSGKKTYHRARIMGFRLRNE